MYNCKYNHLIASELREAMQLLRKKPIGVKATQRGLSMILVGKLAMVLGHLKKHPLHADLLGLGLAVHSAFILITHPFVADGQHACRHTQSRYNSGNNSINTNDD